MVHHLIEEPNELDLSLMQSHNYRNKWPSSANRSFSLRLVLGVLKLSIHRLVSMNNSIADVDTYFPTHRVLRTRKSSKARGQTLNWTEADLERLSSPFPRIDMCSCSFVLD